MRNCLWKDIQVAGEKLEAGRQGRKDIYFWLQIFLYFLNFVPVYALHILQYKYTFWKVSY